MHTFSTGAPVVVVSLVEEPKAAWTSISLEAFTAVAIGVSGSTLMGPPGDMGGS